MKAVYPKPIDISRFLGLNESIGESEVRIGEAVDMKNFRITNNYKLQKRSGYVAQFTALGTGSLNGMWHGIIDGTEMIVFSYATKLYKWTMSDSPVEIGAITNAFARFFLFSDTLYIINGADFKSYDGTTYQDVDPYIPTVAIEAPPAGGGTLYEEINLLTGKKKQTFVGDGAETTYQLAETGIDATTIILDIDGTSKTEDTHFTVNRTNGTIDFSAGTSPHGAPANEAEVTIQWEKVASGHADLVKKNTCFLLFGVGNDTNVFLWGNPAYPNRRMRSGTLLPNYWPVNNFTLIGSDEFAITDIVPQYDTMVIFKEDRTYFSSPEYSSATEKYEYVVYPLNDSVGNAAEGQAQLLDNNPVTLHQGSIRMWQASQVRDERNVVTISDRIMNSLSSVDLSAAVTVDFQKKKEFWVNIGSDVFVYNYGNDTFYKYDNISADCFLEADGELYFGSAGTIFKFDDDEYDDPDGAVEAKWESGFTDFGIGHLRKNSRKLWITINPENRVLADVTFRTDRKAVNKEVTAKYAFASFEDVDFSNYSFSTSRALQPFRFKMRAKKYAYIQFVISNDTANTSLTVLSLKVLAEATGEIK